ncbi:MAG: hypothetical protein J6W60_10705, partial [Treponema sp.]|nr:hypothetical protein [Treponema sp.]
MGKQTVFVEDRIIKLDTSLTPSSYAKSINAERLTEKGRLARKTSEGWMFEPWGFTDTEVKTHTTTISGIERKAGETVVLHARGFSGTTLKDLLDMESSKELSDGERSRIHLAGAAVCSAMEAAIQQKEPVENTGAGGIVVSDDCTHVLFLPLIHFESSTMCTGEKEYSAHQGFYINPTLTGDAAIHFTQSVIAYRLLTGKLPFTETAPDKRHMDIIDANYTPLSTSVWALDETLASFIDNSLQRKALVRNKKTGKKLASSLADKITSIIVEKEKTDSDDEPKHEGLGLAFPLESLYRELGLTENGEIPPMGKLNPVIRKSNISPEIFEQKGKKREAFFQKKLKVKRWLRSARIPLLISASVIIVISALFISIASGHSEDPTSKGLTSTQTIEMFYSGMNTLNSTAMHECSTGDKASELENMVTTMYVTGKTVAAYDATKKLVSPAEWINFNHDGHYTIFGLADFYIQTSKGSLFFNAPTKNTKPKTITDDGDGKPVKNGDIKTIPVSYIMLYTEGTDSNTLNLNAVYHNDTVTLEFRKNRWIITDIQEQTDLPITTDYETFL